MKPLNDFGDWASVCPWRSKRVLLLLVDGEDTWQASSLTEKRALLAHRGGNVFAFWPGEWSATAREVTDRDAVLTALS